MQIPNIFNQIDKIYIEKTGIIYPVSVVGNKTEPQPQELTDVVFGPWEENSDNRQYFSSMMSTEETLLFSEDPSLLPEGWYAIVTTDYGAIRLTVDDVSSANSLDIPRDTSDLTNMLYYTGSDETLATDIKFFDANGNLLYYCAQQNVGVIRTPVEISFTMENAVLTVNMEDYNLVADVAIDNAPAGWYGWFSPNDTDTIDFTEADINNGQLLVNVVGYMNTLPSQDTAHVAIFNGEPLPENIIYEDFAVPFTFVNNTL